MGAAPGADCLSWADLQRAKMTEETGLAQPVEYTEAERRTIATHEAGHATTAWLVGQSRKLEVRRMLAEHRVVVEALRDALLERHELIGDETLQVIVDAEPSLPPARSG